MNSNIGGELLGIILEREEFMDYLHPSIEGRIPIKIVGWKEVDGQGDVKVLGSSVEFFGAGEIQPDQAYLEIVSWEQQEKGIKFTLKYKIEGLVIDGFATQIDHNSHWSISKFEVYEE